MNTIQSDNPEYRVEIAESIQEVEKLRPIWESMQWYPDTDIDLYLELCNSKKEILRPHVQVLYKNGVPATMVICRLEDKNFRLTFGYKVVFQKSIRSLTVLYGGIIGDTSPSACEILLSNLQESLRKRKADVVFFNHLKIDSDLFRLATTIPGSLMRDHNPVPYLHWKMELPDSYDEFYKTRSRNFKNNLKKYSKRLTDQYGGNIFFKCLHKEEELGYIIKDVETIASKTYHRGLGVGFVNDLAMQNRIKQALSRNLFRAYILYINDIPGAYLIGVKYGATYFPWYTGFDQMYQQFSPGTLLFAQVIEALYHDGRIEAVDFGFGDAFYKHNFCDTNWEEASVYIYAPTIKGAYLNIMNTMVTSSAGLVDGFLKRFDVYEKIKKIWRSRKAQELKVADNAD